MADNYNTENDKKADEVVNSLFDYYELKDIIKNEQERKKQLAPILKKIVLSKNKVEIEENIKELMESLDRFGVKFYDEGLYEDKSKARTPIFWSNATDSGFPNSNEYNSGAYHYYLSNNKLIVSTWKIIGEAVKLVHDHEFKDTYCWKMSEAANNVLLARLMSEIWIKSIPLKDILNKELVIEFGQNSLLFDESKVFSTTDSTMSAYELPILLDRIAKHNLDIDSGIAVGEKIYLEKTGVSKKQIKNGEQEDIEYNSNKGLIVVKKVERNLKGSVLKEYIRVPIELRYLILKLEKQRLKKIITRLEESRELMTERNVLIKAAEENSNIQNSFDNEEQQHNFIERARQKQETNYLMSEYFTKNKGEIQEENEHPLETLLNEKRNILRATEAERNETCRSLLIREKEASESLFTKLWRPIKGIVKKYTQRYEFLRNLTRELGNLINGLNFSGNYKNKGVDEALIDKLKKLNGANEELLGKGAKEFKLLSTAAKMEVLDKLNESNKEIGGKTRIIADVNEVRV